MSHEKTSRILPVLTAAVMSLTAIAGILPVRAEDAGEPQPVVLEDVKAIQAFVSDSDYVGPGETPDLNGDGCVDVFDLALAKRQLLKTGVPSLTDFASETWDIYLDTEEQVTFTVHVTEIATLAADAVALCAEGETVAQMHDDGKDGDETADDGIYTAVVTLSSPEIKLVDYYAEAMDVRSNTHEISFYRDLEESEFEGFFALQDKLAAMTFEEVCAYVEDCAEITEYDIDEAAESVLYRTVYHIGGLWVDDDWEEEAEEEEAVEPAAYTNAGKTLSSLPGSTILSNDSAASLVPAHPDKKDVAVLLPIPTLRWAKAEKAGIDLAQALGGNFVEFTQKKVTVKMMACLSDFGVVIIKTHGRTSDGIPYFAVGTTEKTETVDSADLERYNVIVRNNDKHYAIGPGFFDKYYPKGSMKDSLWILNCCYGLSNSKLSSMMRSRGAGAVIGFSDRTNGDYSDNIVSAITQHLIAGSTIEEAVAAAKEEKGAVDPTLFFPGSEVRFKGKKNFRLMEEPDTGKYRKIVDAINKKG